MASAFCEEGDHYAKDMVAMLENFKFTYQKAPTPTPNPLSGLSWIEREINRTGRPPQTPDWLFPYVVGPIDPYTLNAIRRGTLELEPATPGEFRRVPGLVWSGQELVLISSQTWCGFSPTQRLMVVELALWLGDNFDRQSGIWEVWNRCPPAASY